VPTCHKTRSGLSAITSAWRRACVLMTLIATNPEAIRRFQVIPVRTSNAPGSSGVAGSSPSYFVQPFSPRRLDRRCSPMNGLARSPLPRPLSRTRAKPDVEIIVMDHGASAHEVRAVVTLQGVVRIGRLSCAVAPRAKCPMCLHSSAIRPSRSLRLLSCPPNWAVGRLLACHTLLHGLIITELTMARADVR
jgi:hypothetical protein